MIKRDVVNFVWWCDCSIVRCSARYVSLAAWKRLELWRNIVAVEQGLQCFMIPVRLDHTVGLHVGGRSLLAIRGASLRSHIPHLILYISLQSISFDFG